MSLVSKSFSDIITFTRTSNATQYNSAGLLVMADANMLTYSEQLDNAAWTKTNVTVTANAVTAPDGALTADMLTMTNTSNDTYQTATVIALMTYTYSFYALRGTATELKYRVYNVSGAADIVASTSYYASTNSSTWSRISVSFTAPAGCTSVRVYALDATGVTGTAYIWGGQLNRGSAADPYTATTASAYYAPRLDYDPATLLPRGFLVEEARTNLLTYSEQFDNAAWVKSNATVTANAVTAPDGLTTADKLVEEATTSVHYAFQTKTVAAGPVSFSCFVKAGERTQVAISAYEVSVLSNPVSAIFDLSTGLLVLSAGLTTSTTIRSCGNGWYFLSVSGISAGTSATWSIRSALAGSTTYTGNGTSGIYIWGAQLEAGSFPTSYIATTSAQVTRAADVATMTGTNFSDWFNAAAGTLLVEWSSPSSAIDFPIAAISDGTTNNRYQEYYGSATSILVRTSASGVAANNNFTGSTTTGANKSAFAFGSGGTRASLNGGSVSTTTQTLPSVLDRFYFGATAAGAGQKQIWLRKVTYYPTVLSDAQLQALTA